MTEQEELQMLRALTQKQKEELAAKECIIEEPSIRIEKQNVQIENMIQALLHARKNVYVYLKYLLSEMPNSHHLEHPEILDRYLPWSSELKRSVYE